ncbi:hypothetical protein [Aneurinibacillus aneurinilyticus]|nr:hypothetical protein [Aneurinibacillus aneurinilyticus]MCI1695699.1 SMI1/KNR4 family protein [Aneurinibacillus aneurinilyticus]MED0707689.1 SMI1/KNR4 family protein [Aneurinibacillus aneurinilyticus]MED0722777.1 SMI1/KNR4 family protein [Aneurinibacillus aneurinilyticus]MED0734538.1 SMI1/KNR4 family protein [Aneurinibacillus aneurinilyticus]MED0743672.1 SMI1/KNR4 family protein [Aneurinibacillus aneurinilyticus]
MKINEDFIKNLELLNDEIDKIREYMTIEICTINELDEAQIGYGIDSEGNSLIKGEASWDEDWIVIGRETMCGDPIIADAAEAGYSISILMHDMESWEGGSYLAESISEFLKHLQYIGIFIEQNGTSIRKRDIENLVKTISEKDSYTDGDSWELLLQPLFTIAKQYEDEMKAKIAHMLEQGLKMSVISERVNMPTKEVYEYMKVLKRQGEKRWT